MDKPDNVAPVSRSEPTALPSSSQELPSSPPRMQSDAGVRRKPKKPPPVTPRSFTRFFTPRSMLHNSGNSGGSKPNRRALEILSSPALNRLGPAFARTSSKPCRVMTADSESLGTPAKKRKLSTSSPVSPNSPLQSSPLKGARVKSPAHHENALEGTGGKVALGPEEVVDVEKRTSSGPTDAYVAPIRRSRVLQTSGNLCMRSMYGPRANRVTIRANSGAG